MQQVLDWQPFSSVTTRDTDEESGVVVTSTFVFKPHDGGTKVVVYFLCEPKQASARIQTILGSALESGMQILPEIIGVSNHP